MCILLSSLTNNGKNLNYPLLFLWLFITSLSMGTFPHIKIETKLSTLEDITIGVLALVLCIVLSFAAYFLYLRVSANRRRTSSSSSSGSSPQATINGYNRSTRDYSQSRLVSMNDENNNNNNDIMSETTALLQRTKSVSNDCGDDNEHRNHDQLSSYVSFGAYGAAEDKESTSP
mmetsp:Transcript_27214/g.24032  ORF Transcript_27214/g.24032 Transcript_27214/m.24032 type:complete len:174 (+) Transcript_27214:98-619(+)